MTIYSLYCLEEKPAELAQGGSKGGFHQGNLRGKQMK